MLEIYRSRPYAQVMAQLIRRQKPEIVLFGASTFLSACNTVAGVGQDVSHAGHEITEEAKEHK